METCFKNYNKKFRFFILYKIKKDFHYYYNYFFFDRKKDGCGKRLTIYHLVFKCVDRWSK